jgi:hypothetical protein
VKTSPATVIVPVRSLLPVCLATSYRTVPLPVPLAASSVIQGSLLDAVQLQAAVVFTSNVLVPPFFPMSADDGESV